MPADALIKSSPVLTAVAAQWLAYLTPDPMFASSIPGLGKLSPGSFCLSSVMHT